MHTPPGLIPDSSVLVSLITLLAITAVFLGLAIFIFYNKEYKFE